MDFEFSCAGSRGIEEILFSVFQEHPKSDLATVSGFGKLVQRAI